MVVMWIGIGGALGAVARYLLGEWIAASLGLAFPWGTLSVNAIGSLLLGMLAGIAATVGASAELRGLVAVGFLGAFTTYSTYSVEAISMMREGDWSRAGAYLAATLVICLAAAGGGWAAGAALAVR